MTLQRDAKFEEKAACGWKMTCSNDMVYESLKIGTFIG